ncbi:hypothetical protein [Streptosporangium roseum]|uniref:hypothetical protein n=1 Tax=Streptosporangium roseum TaxID=2001 RepID=UPI0001A38A10|nr:hypothetical protein [Streptosporangium roseum]
MPVDERGSCGRDVIELSSRDPFPQERLLVDVTAQVVEQVVVRQMARRVAVVVAEMFGQLSSDSWMETAP